MKAFKRFITKSALIVLLIFLLIAIVFQFHIFGLHWYADLSTLTLHVWIEAKPQEVAPIFSREVMYWKTPIERWGKEIELDPNLIATVMQIESCGNPKAISRAGAMGLFQVMPFHFLLGDIPFDPDTNAFRGLKYLKKSLDVAGGNVHLALAGYNGGIGVISRPESTWPSETLLYVSYGDPIYEAAVNYVPDRTVKIKTAGSNDELQNSAAITWANTRGKLLCRQAANVLGLMPSP